MTSYLGSLTTSTSKVGEWQGRSLDQPHIPRATAYSNWNPSPRWTADINPHGQIWSADRAWSPVSYSRKEINWSPYPWIRRFLQNPQFIGKGTTDPIRSYRSWLYQNHRNHRNQRNRRAVKLVLADHGSDISRTSFPFNVEPWMIQFDILYFLLLQCTCGAQCTFSGAWGLLIGFLTADCRSFQTFSVTTMNISKVHFQVIR